MTDREVQAISQFLLNFGYLGCYQITVCRRNVEELSREQIGQAVLDIREAWKREGLDVENLYTNDLELFPGMSKKWGLSFLINTQQAPTGRSAGSLAWAGLANTYFWIDRTKRVAGVFLSQVLPFYDQTAIDLFGRFETEVYRAT